MELTTELKERITVIKQIYFNAKAFFTDAEYLYYPDTENERKVANETSFIRRVRIACWRSVVLELCKLYIDKDNEHYNLLRLFRNLKTKYDHLSKQNNVSEDDIEKWTLMISRYKVVDTVQRLKALRDKQIAHTDRNTKSENNHVTVTFKEIKEIFSITESVLFEIISLYFDTHQIFELPDCEKAGNILNIITERKEQYFISKTKNT